MRGACLQYLATISAALLMASGAVVNMWSSPVLPQLLSEHSPIGITVTKDEASLITSLLLFGSVLGNIILGSCIDFFGRRGTLLLASVPIFLCWFIIIYAQSVMVLYVARFVQGIFVAASMAIPMLYIGEISEAQIRGRLTISCCIISEISMVLTVLLGSVLSYKLLGFFATTFPVLFFVTFYWMPESPYFYVKKADYYAAEKSLQKFRNRNDVSEELNKMRRIIEDNLSDEGSFMDLFRIGRFKTGILILIGLKTLHQMSGGTAILSYMKIIFQDTKTGLNADVSSIISISVGLPASSMTSLLMESAYFFLQSYNKINTTNPFFVWLPTLGIFLFQIFKSFGMQTLPVLILGEIFPPQVKGYATSLLLVYGSILASLIAWGFPKFSDEFGYGVSFLIFACFCLGGFLFVKMLVPETKGKMLAEISKEERNFNK